MERTQRDGILFILLSVVGYAMFPVFARSLLPRGLEPIDLAVWRYAIAAPLMWLLVFGTNAPAPTPERPMPRLLLVVMGSMLALAALAGFSGLSILPAGTYVVLFFSFPAMVALISAFLGERLSGRGWLALGLTLVGISLTAPDFSEGLSGENARGVLIAFFNALVVAIYFVIVSRVLRGQRAVARASAWAITGSAVFLIATALVFGAGGPRDLEEWGLIIAMAAVSTVLPVFTLNMGLQRLGGPRAAILGTTEPLLAAVLAQLLLGEQMLPEQWLGGLVIVFSVILLESRRLPQSAQRAESAAGGD
ncbi:MAG: DMT family transporter [Chloroflexi bacterium]|nr:DMT family transporter [Chloroflexota bacterium]